MTITLTPEIEGALAEEAHRQGTTPELLALNCLRQRFAPGEAAEPSTAGKGTLADFAGEALLRKGPWPANEAMLAALRRVEEIQRGMNPKPGGDTQAYIREARAGGLYGREPTD
jgi:hypothetical protein